MKVMCINDCGWILNKSLLWGIIKYNKYSTGPKYGDILHVTNTEYEKGELYYFFKEWPEDGSYDSIEFIPIQNEDIEYEEMESEKINFVK